MTCRSSLSFVSLRWFLVKLQALVIVNLSDQTVFWTFFLNACRYWPDFLACKLVTTTYRLSLRFVKLYRFGGSKYQWSNSFLHFFPKHLQILSWFLACKSIIMTYRSSLSFIAPHWLFAKLRVLHFINFTDGTVFQTFFYTLTDIALIFDMLVNYQDS